MNGIATSGAAIQVAGTRVWVIVVYSLLGVGIATVGGLQAAFKLTERSAELTVLAATCLSMTREVDTRWQREVGPAYGEAREEAAQQILELQDAKLTDVHERAARLGVNTALQVREVWGDSPGPYAA